MLYWQLFDRLFCEKGEIDIHVRPCEEAFFASCAVFMEVPDALMKINIVSFLTIEKR